MANILLRQVIAGKTQVSTVIDEDVFTALQGELAGELQQYTEQGTQGTLKAPPTQLNKQRYSVGKKTGRSYENCSFTIPHVKVGASSVEVEALAIANLNANWVSTTTPEYCNLLYDARKEA